MIPMIPRLINIQGALGIAASLALFGLLLIQKGETRHWRKQSHGFETLYRGQQQAHAQTVANYRVAAEAARGADSANRDRVLAAQADINERTTHAYEARISDARARVDRMRGEAGAAAADPSAGRAAPLPAARAPARAADGAAAKNGLPFEDALIATEQAIQLDELIKWVRAQAAVDNDGRGGSIPDGRNR
jgi:hypothetical protein